MGSASRKKRKPEYFLLDTSLYWVKIRRKVQGLMQVENVGPLEQKFNGIQNFNLHQCY